MSGSSAPLSGSRSVDRGLPRLTSAQAAARLGIKTQTLYAYVARGLLARDKGVEGERGSTFDALEVERFAAHRRRRSVSESPDGRQVGAPLMVIETTIALIEDDELYFCGQRAVDLALSHRYADVAEWLWTGHLAPDVDPRNVHPRNVDPRNVDPRNVDPRNVDPRNVDPRDVDPRDVDHLSDVDHQTDQQAVDLARRVVVQLPPTATLRDQLQVATTTLGSMDPLRFDLSPTTVVRIAGRYLAGVVDALPDFRSPSTSTTPGLRTGTTSRSRPDMATGSRPDTAAQLWPKLTALAPTEAGLRCLNAALVLLVDHDLAISTLAARAAASARANPYAVVSSGLSALDSSLHGNASVAAHRLVSSVMAGANPARAIADSVLHGAPGGIPGFGHRLYQGWDPRARLLLDLLDGPGGLGGPDLLDGLGGLGGPDRPDSGQRRAARHLEDRSPTMSRAALTATQRIIEVVRQRTGRTPNVDLALATLVIATEMRPDAGEAIFAVARSGGWLAHALDEYGRPPLRLRPVGHYIGL